MTIELIITGIVIMAAVFVGSILSMMVYTKWCTSKRFIEKMMNKTFKIAFEKSEEIQEEFYKVETED